MTNAWFHPLNIHAPLQDCLAMLAEDGLRMHFPDGDIREFATFERWYDRVTHLFFDEQHTIRSIEVVNDTNDRVDGQLRMRWQSGWWEAPAPPSKRIDADVTQKWTGRLCSPCNSAFDLEIVDYYVLDDFVYAPGSALLPPGPPVDSQDLAALNERIGFAESSGDREWLSTILAPRLAFLQKVKAGGTRETRIIEPIQLFGDRAVVQCIVTVGDQEFLSLRLFVQLEGQ